MAVQLYIASKTFEVPPVIVEDDEMLDFEDIGGIYNDPSVSAASNNTSKLETYLNDESNSPGISLMFSGNKSATWNNKRVPQPAYFDLSSGPVNNIATATNHADVQFFGLTGSKIVGLTSQNSLTPLLFMQRYQGSGQQIVLQNLIVENPTGCGIKLTGTTSGQGPGQGVRISGCKFQNIGTALGAQTFDYDGWSDMDTVPYAIYVDEADGCMLSDVVIININGNGIVSTRWHEGLCHAGIRECQGTGFKGQEINGTTLAVRAESNKCWGIHVRDTGNERYTTGGIEGSEGAPNAWDIWLEANNARESTSHPYLTSTGYAWRQMKVDSSSRLTIGGHSGWADNKVQLSEGVRRSCRFIEADYIDPSADGTSAVLLYDMNSDGVSAIGGAFDNWTTQWPDVGDRPSVATTGATFSDDLEVQITIPAGCYDAVATPGTSGYWNMQPSESTAQDGDMLIWEAEVSCDAPGVQYCEDREAIVGANRMPSWLGSLIVNGPVSGLSTFALWSTAKRKLSNRVYMENGRTAHMQCNVYFDGMGDVASSGTTYPEFDIQLNIHSLRLYRGA